MPPFVAERVLPVDIGLDAVAVADVNRGRAGEAFDCLVQRLDAPFLHFRHVNVERRLIELHDVDTVRLERARFLVQQPGEGKRHLHAIAIIGVGNRVDDGHRAGQGELELVLCVARGVPRLGLVYAALEPQRAGHRRHHRLIAIVADAHLDLAGEIDALDLFEEAVHEMLPRHFAIGDDVDAGALLQLDRFLGRLELAGLKLRAGEFPRRPQLVGFGKPCRFRQAAGNRRRKKCHACSCWRDRRPHRRASHRSSRNACGCACLPDVA